MTRAVCSGSFDPVTLGHLDIFERAGRIFDELIICVFHNVRKKSFFSVEERVALLKKSTAHISNLRVDSFSGLLTDYMKAHEVRVIVRGVRSVADLEYEQNEARMIAHLSADVETVFLLTNPKYSFVSSSGIRELASFGAEVRGLVPECVERAIAEKMAGL